MPELADYSTYSLGHTHVFQEKRVCEFVTVTENPNLCYTYESNNLTYYLPVFKRKFTACKSTQILAAYEDSAEIAAFEMLETKEQFMLFLMNL